MLIPFSPKSQFRFAFAIAVMILGLGMSGCTISRDEPTLPNRNSIVKNELVIHSNHELPKEHRLVQDLSLRRREISNLLGIPKSENPIDVYLFDTPNEFRRYILKYHPDFPDRRALFVKDGDGLVIYAAWNPRLSEDLRHEVTHGYLHSVAAGLPLWIDEGLAEFFEVERGRNGVNASHLFLLQNELDAGRWQPDLVRLEALRSSATMTQLDYAESWLWTHYLLTNDEANRKPIVQAHLHQLVSNGSAFPISAAIEREYPDASRLLIKHLLQLGENHP